MASLLGFLPSFCLALVSTTYLFALCLSPFSVKNIIDKQSVVTQEREHYAALSLCGIVYVALVLCI